MTPDEMIEVIQAYKDRKQLEWRCKAWSNKGWMPVENPSWNFNSNEYRIKPEPKIYYANIYTNEKCYCLYLTKEAAIQGRINPKSRIVKLIEVIEE